MHNLFELFIMEELHSSHTSTLRRLLLGTSALPYYAPIGILRYQHEPSLGINHNIKFIIMLSSFLDTYGTLLFNLLEPNHDF